MDKLYIIIPAYNEEENIRKVINDWYPIIESIGEGSKLVIIDDGSKDNTLAIIKSENKKDLVTLSKTNSGHGGAILYGYKYAIKHGADYIFQTDSDGQTLPSEFKEFWKIRKSYDMVIGNRNHRQDGLSRVLVSKVLKVILFLIFKVSVTDANTPYRLMRADSLKKYINLIPKDYKLTNVLISVIFTKHKKKVKYLPITFLPRQGGINSINIAKILKIGLEAIKDFINISKNI